MAQTINAQKRDEIAARQWFGYKSDQHLTEVQKGEVMKMALFLARHIVGMRDAKLYDAALLERNHWQDRAMRAENKLLHARNRISPVIEFYADAENWNSGDVPGHIYAHDDSGYTARKLCSEGWTAKGRSWLADGAPLTSSSDLEVF